MKQDIAYPATFNDGDPVADFPKVNVMTTDGQSRKISRHLANAIVALHVTVNNDGGGWKGCGIPLAPRDVIIQFTDRVSSIRR